LADAPRARWLWTPVVAYMAFIFTLSSISNTPALPGGTDKDVHALLYAGLGATLIRAIAGGWRRRVTGRMALLAVAVAAAYGVSDEFHQWFVPRRQADGLDAIADATGAAASVSALYVWSRLDGASRRRRPV
jgi:VanZ family protein